MSVMQGTISPTHFTVVYDDSQFKPDVMQKLAYALTHMYFNWPGNVKVPAPCQYSHKLVELVGDHLHNKPSDIERKAVLSIKSSRSQQAVLSGLHLKNCL